MESEAESFNVAIVRGCCSSVPEVRVLPSSQRIAQLSADNLKRAAGLAAWRRGLLRGWNQVPRRLVRAGFS